ncbi:TPA: Ig-like domain-containing protein [Photobacterium damselae]
MYKALIFFLLLISGCDSSSKVSEPLDQKPAVETKIYENRFVQFSNELDSAKLDLNQLYNNIEKDTEVRSINNCKFSLKGGDLTIDNKKRSCFFRIGDDSDSGILHILFNNENMINYINGYTRTILINASVEEDVVIDLTKELSYLPFNLDEYTLKESNDVFILNDKKVKIDVNDKEINIGGFSPNDIVKLAYSLKSKNSDEIISGYILIATSTPVNALPSAENFELSSKVPAFELLNGIDVKSKISDPDGDPLQLVDVFAFNASVAVENKDDPLCKSSSCTTFSFKASSVGSFDVSYVIADHFGGYALGIVRIQTEISGTIPGLWVPIFQNKDHLTFTPPLTVEQSHILGFMYQDHFFEKHGTFEYDVTLYNYNMAEMYCSLLGLRLPEISEIRQLYTENGDLSLLANPEDWSTERVYWTKSEIASDSHLVFDFKTVTDSTLSDDQVAQASCVNDGHLVEFFPDQYEKALPLDGSDVQFELNSRLETSDGYPNIGKIVYIFDHSDDTNIIDSSPITDSSGIAKTNLEVNRLGSYEVFSTYLNDILSINIDVIAYEIGGFFVEPKALELDLGDPLNNSYDLEAFVNTVSEPGKDINVTNSSVWSSSDSSIVSVDAKNGHIEAESVGKAVITAEYEYNGVKYSDSSTVTVVDNSVKLMSLSIDPAILPIKPADVAYLNSAYAHYSDGTDKEVSDLMLIESIAPRFPGITESFVYNGALKAIYALNSAYMTDKYVLTFKYTEDGKSVTDTVLLDLDVVAPVRYTSLDVKAPSSMKEGDSANATATANFSDSSSEIVTDLASWSSDKPAIVSVDTKGGLTAKSAGTAKITATYKTLGTTHSDSVTITVSSVPPPPTDDLLSITVSPKSNTLEVGDSVTLSVTAHYSISGNQVVANNLVEWSSADSGVASVYRGIVTAKSVGTTTITAKYKGMQDFANVVVRDSAIVIPAPNAEISRDCSYDFTGKNHWKIANETGCIDSDPNFKNILGQYQPFWGNPVGGTPSMGSGLMPISSWYIVDISGPIRRTTVTGKSLRVSAIVYCSGIGNGRFTDNLGQSYTITCLGW